MPRRHGRAWLPNPGATASLLGVAISVYLLDQVTKMWALDNLVVDQPVPVWGEWLQFHLIHNPGAAFSLGTGLTPVFTAALAVVSLAILVAAGRVGSLRWATALGLMLGGASGNLTDRMTRPPGTGRGEVIDFLRIPNWPIFNVADMSIVTAAALIALLTHLGVHFAHRRTARGEGASGGTDTTQRGVGTPDRAASLRPDEPTGSGGSTIGIPAPGEGERG